MNPLELIRKYYKDGSRGQQILLTHSEMVAGKACQLAERVADLQPDLAFISEAALLHDIGMFFTQAPEIGCHGTYPYICHGYLGRRLLEKEGYPRHALVCERHTGTGLSREEILARNLPLPARDMLPVSLEEQIICFADKFFSKDPGMLRQELPVQKVRERQARYGEDHARQIDAWCRFFKLSGV